MPIRIRRRVRCLLLLTSISCVTPPPEPAKNPIPSSTSRASMRESVSTSILIGRGGEISLPSTSIPGVPSTVGVSTPIRSPSLTTVVRLRSRKSMEPSSRTLPIPSLSMSICHSNEASLPRSKGVALAMGMSKSSSCPLSKPARESTHFSPRKPCFTPNRSSSSYISSRLGKKAGDGCGRLRK